MIVCVVVNNTGIIKDMYLLVAIYLPNTKRFEGDMKRLHRNLFVIVCVCLCVVALDK